MSNARHSSTASPQHVNSILNKIFICNGVFFIKQYRVCHSVPLLMGYVNVCSCAIYGGTWEWGLKFANCCGEGKRRINSERYEWRHHSCRDATRALPVKIMQREKAPEGCLVLQPGCVWRIQCHIKPRMRLYVGEAINDLWPQAHPVFIMEDSMKKWNKSADKRWEEKTYTAE